MGMRMCVGLLPPHWQESRCLDGTWKRAGARQVVDFGLKTVFYSYPPSHPSSGFKEDLEKVIVSS